MTYNSYTLFLVSITAGQRVSQADVQVLAHQALSRVKQLSACCRLLAPSALSQETSALLALTSSRFSFL